MLNINAKAFVPQSIGENININANTFYRYHISLPKERPCDISESSSVSSGIMTLLGKRWLTSSSQGGLGEDPLQLFITSFFDNVENISDISKRNNPNTGIILSRSILSLSGAVAAINSINNSQGFLIHINISKEYKADISIQLRAIWDDFFEFFREDIRITSLGYISSISNNSSKEILNYKEFKGNYRHYFFISCIPLNLQQEPLTLKNFLNSQFPFIRVTEINSVVPFVCNVNTPIGIIISIGEKAKENLFLESKPDISFIINFYPYDISKTILSYNEFEKNFFSFLKNENYKWERTYIIHIDIKIENLNSEKLGKKSIPFCDIIYFINNLCDDISCSILGISLSEDIIKINSNLFLNNNNNKNNNSYYINATLESILKNYNSLDFLNINFDRIPNCIKKSISLTQYEYIYKKIESLLLLYKEPTILTRMVFATAADNFAKSKYYVRNRCVGEKILIITDTQGDIFGVNLNTGSIFALPNCFGGVISPVRNSIFEATLTSSYRGYLEYVIILEDILFFEGNDIRGIPLPERWHYIEKTILDDYSSHPHINKDSIIILRTLYSTLDRADYVFKNPPLDFPTLGLIFVPHVSNNSDNNNNNNNNNKDFLTFSWIPPETITAKFSVGKIEDILDSNGEIKRAWLYVKDDNDEIISYNEEYVDFILDSYPYIKNGSIIECILRRSDDGAHWWELLKYYDTNTLINSINLFEYVDKLVHTPGLTHEEMLWLLKASTFKCGRCQTVSDIGRVNSKYQIYWCQRCWEETGHGDCVYCGCFSIIGKIDSISKHFYCDTCWSIFATTNANAEIGYLVPPPPNASFAKQVLTRCISLLIDIINPKAPTDDVLDICCGGAVTQKWIRNKTTRYVGFDLKDSVVEATTELISSLSNEMLENSSYKVICADAFSKDLWTQHITKIHPQQFHAITSFAGIHHAFSSVSKARHVVGSIANALVPQGVFFGCFLDASTLFSRGNSSNELFSVEWDEDFVPRIGHHFLFSIQDGPKKKINVIAIDFFVAIAQEYGLTVMPELCLTFRELLENDPKFTKVPSKSEKEYLCAMRTFAFKKNSDPLTSPPSRNNGTIIE